MALMKTGRKMSMPKGEDPKKPNGNNKPTEPPKKQYTWEDVERNEATKSRNRAAKEQYESDVANYNRAMKLYNEGASYDVSNKDVSTINKNSSAKFTAATGGISAREMSEDYEKGIKSGEYVDINDPRISENNRYYLKGTFVNSKDSNKFGNVTNRAVPASVAFEKDLSWKKLYGEDYDPYKWRKDAKSGNLEGYTSGKFRTPNYGGYLEKYDKAEQAKAPTYEKEENIDVNRLPLPRMEKKKSNIQPLRISESKSQSTEKPDWEEPKGSTKYRTKYSLPDISTTDKGKSLGRFVKSKVESIGKDNALSSGLRKEQGKERLIQGKSGREAKMAKAYFSNYEGKSKFDIEGYSEDRGVRGKLNADKADLKAGIKEARKAGDREKVQGYRAAKKDVKSEIKQAKLASKYVTKLGQELTGVRAGEELMRTGSIKTNTPDKYLGFQGSKQDKFDSDANFNKFLANRATENATNKNTISKKLADIEPKRTRAQRIEERDTQNRVMKNLPK